MALRRSLAWLAFAQTGTVLLQFAGTVVLARYLTPYETGIYAIAAATAGALSVIQALGLQNLIIREPHLNPSFIATTFTVNLLLSLTLSAGIAGASILGGALLHDAGVRRVLLALALTPLFGIVEFLPLARLEREGRFKATSLAATLGAAAGTGVTVAFALSGFSYMSLVYGQWARRALMVILVSISGRQYLAFGLGFAAWRRVAAFGLQMLAVSGISALSGRIAELALGRILGLEALGIYARATGLNNMLSTNIHLVAARAVFVDYADLHRQGISLRQRYMGTVEFLTAILWPAFGGCAVLSAPLVLTVFGEPWLPAALPLSLLSVASIIRVSITMSWELFAVTGNLSAQTRIEFIRALLTLAAFVLGCFVSLSAAAAAGIFDAMLAVYLYRRHLDRMTDTTVWDLMPIYLRSAGLTVIATGPASLLVLSYHLSAHIPFHLVLGSIALGIGLWAAAIVLLKHPLLAETMLLLRRIRFGTAANPAGTASLAAPMAHGE